MEGTVKASTIATTISTTTCYNILNACNRVQALLYSVDNRWNISDFEITQSTGGIIDAGLISGTRKTLIEAVLYIPVLLHLNSLK
jgi:hypothetical protein